MSQPLTPRDSTQVQHVLANVNLRDCRKPPNGVASNNIHCGTAPSMHYRILSDDVTMTPSCDVLLRQNGRKTKRLTANALRVCFRNFVCACALGIGLEGALVGTIGDNATHCQVSFVFTHIMWEKNETTTHKTSYPNTVKRPNIYQHNA